MGDVKIVKLHSTPPLFQRAAIKFTAKKRGSHLSLTDVRSLSDSSSLSEIGKHIRDPLKRKGRRGWLKSRSRRFWILIGAAGVAILILAVYLPLFFHMRRQTVSVTGPLAQRWSADVIPNSYLIDIDTSEDEDTRVANRQKVISSLDQSGIQYTISRVISSSVYNGFRVNVEDDNVVSDIVRRSDVKNAWPIRLRYRPAITPVPSPSAGSTTQNFSVPATDFPFYPPHLMTGVDKLHLQGIQGAGVNIGIIDTGVDFTHPALGGCFGPGCKIVGGVDLVGDAFNGTNNPVQGGKPLDQCNGHGTHVSGIIAADARNASASQPFVGVAPAASIFMYRAFGCNGTTTDDVIIHAMSLAFLDGVDIISMSIGGPHGFSEDPASVVASRLASKGVVINIAAGNDGGKGLLLASSPADGLNAISVGSVDNVANIGWTSITSNNRSIKYLSTNPFPEKVSISLYITATSEAELHADACSPLPPDTPDLSQFLVLTKRGTCTFATKISNLAKFNAKLVFFENTENSGFAVFDEGLITAAISFEDGELLRSNPNITVTFPANVKGEFLSNTITGGSMSLFSSWGPTFELKMAPFVSAPGGNIYSTFPVGLGEYATFSGTSMATPYLTGVAALYLSAKTHVTPVELRNLMITTASPLGFNNGSGTTEGLKSPVAQQGGGLLNAFRLLTSTTIISPGFIELNDTTSFQGEHTISITNNGTDSVTYSFGSINTVTTNFLLNSTTPAASPTPVTSDSLVNITITPSTLELDPGATSTFNITFTLNIDGIDTSLIPIYSGFVIVGSSAVADQGPFSIPFIGVAANVTNLPLYATLNQLPSLSVSSPVNQNASFAIPITGVDNVYTMVKEDQPGVDVSFLYGTRVFRLDVLPGNSNFGSDTINVSGLDIFASANGYPITIGLARNNLGVIPTDFTFFRWDGTFANGSAAPNGQYRLAARSLKLLASDLNNPDSWETFITQPFTIVR